MMQKIKAVGTVARMWADNIPSKFVDSLAQLLIYEQSKLPKGKFIYYNKSAVSWHELGRNTLAKETQGDWILMLDTDHCFAPDLLERLMRLKKRYKAKVIAGIYQYKFPPHAPVANMWNDDPTGRQALPIIAWNRQDEVLQVGCTGAGCLLIDKDVFKIIGEKIGKNPFDITPGLSEDYSFAYYCKQAGIPIYLALNVECHHLTTNVLSIQDYQMPPETLVKTEDGKVQLKQEPIISSLNMENIDDTPGTEPATD